MNHIVDCATDYSTTSLRWGNHPAYWRLDREEGPEEADEMERLKERQKNIESERRREQQAEQIRNTSLADQDQLEAWPA